LMTLIPVISGVLPKMLTQCQIPVPLYWVFVPCLELDDKSLALLPHLLTKKFPRLRNTAAYPYCIRK
jgi:hypothetical protein